jgi:hypothetical protein
MSYVTEDGVLNAQMNTELMRQLPHVLMRPAVFPDGNKWCALYGDNLQEGVAGFGDTPAEATDDFNRNWFGQRLTGGRRDG